MERDQVVDLVSQTGIGGLGYLMLLVLLRGATVRELAGVCRSNRHTVGDVLFALEMRGLVVRVQNGRGQMWYVSAQGRAGLLDIEVAEIPPTSSTAAAAISTSSTTEVAVAVAGDVGGKTASIAPRLDPALAKALRAAGIGSNAWPDLAALPHVTVAYINAHAAYARARGDSTGLLITRIRCGDPVPRSKRAKRDEQRDVGRLWAELLEGRKKGR